MPSGICPAPRGSGGIWAEIVLFVGLTTPRPGENLSAIKGRKIIRDVKSC